MAVTKKELELVREYNFRRGIVAGYQDAIFHLRMGYIDPEAPGLQMLKEKLANATAAHEEARDELNTYRASRTA